MHESDNLALVQQGYAAFGRGDLDGLLKLLDPHVTWTTPGPPDLPTAGTFRGRAAVAQFLGTLLDVLNVLRFEPEDFLARGDKVVVIGSDTSVVKATGKTLECRWVHVITVVNGVVVAFEQISDTAALVAELRESQAQL